jgi:hypothetical protein
MNTVNENEVIEKELRLIAEHWQTVETELGRVLLLEGEYARASFLTDTQAVKTHNAALVIKENDVALAGQTREGARTALLAYFTPARTALKAKYPGYLTALPGKPTPTAGETVLLKAGSDLLDLWKRIDSDPAIAASLKPLTVQGNLTQATLSQALSQMQATFGALSVAQKAATAERGARDKAVKAARLRAGQYRNLILSELPADHPLRRTLPT